jgi:hypothetical protein
MAVSRVLRLPPWLRGTLAALAVFSLTCLAWIFFRAASLTEATSMVRRVLSFSDYEMTLGAIPQEFALIFAMALVVLVVDALGRSERVTRWYRASVPRRLAGGYVMLGLILLFGSFAGPRFIYFQF